jgi:hypothetical protein
MRMVLKHILNLPVSLLEGTYGVHYRVEKPSPSRSTGTRIRYRYYTVRRRLELD